MGRRRGEGKECRSSCRKDRKKNSGHQEESKQYIVVSDKQRIEWKGWEEKETEKEQDALFIHNREILARKNANNQTI